MINRKIKINIINKWSANMLLNLQVHYQTKRWCQKICIEMRESSQFELFWRKISISALSACLEMSQTSKIHYNVARNWSWSWSPKFEIMINFLQVHLQWSWSPNRSFSVMVNLIFDHKDHWSYPPMHSTNPKHQPRPKLELQTYHLKRRNRLTSRLMHSLDKSSE